MGDIAMLQPGWVWQEFGDWGEDTVRSLLADDRITVRGIDRDPGEDLSVEPDGRQAVAEGAPPRIALLQVKGSRTEFDEKSATVRGVPMARIRRWSLQRHPVLIVFIAGTQGKRTYARSIDDFLEKRFHGRELNGVAKVTTSIELPHVADLAAWVRQRITEFYERLIPDFTAMSPYQRREHFEVLRSGKPAPWGRATQQSRVVLWRGPRRPAYFAALVQALRQHAEDAIAGGPLPALVHFHVYRSQADRHLNMAAARIDWFEKDHPNLHEALADWPALEIRPSEENDELREFWQRRAVGPERYLEALRPLVDELDAVAAMVIERDDAAWIRNTVTRAEAVERRWHEMPLAPPELEPVRHFVSRYVHALGGHRTWTLRLDEAPHRSSGDRVSEGQRARWRLQDLRALMGFHGAVPQLLAALNW